MPVAIVTGASTGIGNALARELARRKWKVGLVARRTELLEALVGEIRAEGGEAAAASADVGDREAVHGAVQALEAALGPCDLLVANAGIGNPTPVHREPWDTLAEIMRVNYFGAVNAVAAVLPGMLARGRGHLAVVSSVAGFRGLPMHGAYSASKAAVSTLFESWRIELAPRGIVCTAIHPGFVDTPLTKKNKSPMPWIIPAERAAVIVADGLEAGRADITFPWQYRWLMGVARWFPNWRWDRAVGRRAKQFTDGKAA
ncbi:MAG: SDR family NAD(P)-dependent oxidoreductase [Myxococcota bacterium]